VPGEFIPNGIDLAPLERPAGRDEVRRRHDTPADRVVVLFFGALTAQKRPERFVRLIRTLRDAGDDVVGWVLGDGPARGELEALADRLGVAPAMRFLGYRRNVADPVAAADLFVSTSDSEGIPAAVLEAGYLRLPVVGFDVGGMGECVVDGETGLLAPAGDEAALAALVSRLVRDGEERRRLGNAARDFVAGSFSIAAIGRRYEAFYRRLLAGDGA
jgi:glycosyltransferase involved in cell wall biosynthesis